MSDKHLTKTRFDSFPFSESILDGVREAGFEYCTPIQEATLPLALDGQDIAGQAQTGTGKTAAFLLATLHMLDQEPAEPTRRPNQPRALMLAPTRELAIQIHKDACVLASHTGLHVQVVYGGTGYEQQRKALEDGVDILIGTPGRLIDYFKQHVYDLRAVQVLFSYYNPIYQYGLESLARDARLAGADGILVTDITPEEGEEYCARLQESELDPVFLVAPTSGPERIARIAACSRGFIYVISRTGVTGARQELSDSIQPTVERVRKLTKLPVAVGFGISHPDQVKAVWQVCDGAVVGSAIVGAMEKVQDTERLVPEIGKFCGWLTGKDDTHP